MSWALEPGPGPCLRETLVPAVQLHSNPYGDPYGNPYSNTYGPISTGWFGPAEMIDLTIEGGEER